MTEALLAANLALQRSLRERLDKVIQAKRGAEAIEARLAAIANDATATTAAALLPDPQTGFKLPSAAPFFIDQEFQVPPKNRDAAAAHYANIPYLFKNTFYPRLQKNLHGIEWNTIVKSIPGKSAKDCQIQWSVNQHPHVNHAAFSQQEVERLDEIGTRIGWEDWDQIALEMGKLVESVDTFGTSAWSKIAGAMGTRNDLQCRERYLTVLDPALKKGAFSEEENEELRNLVRTHGEKWSLVAREMKTRTAKMCKKQYKLLFS
ncbi:hypothetical protein HDU98_001973 [Podochytrium sp. JEL0797]|nr:hypothetical protein HDU98_001973 [Podochytrium sp. JEL0797]